MQTNRVNNSNIEKYRDVNNLSGSKADDKGFAQTFLKDLDKEGVVFERSSDKKTSSAKTTAVKQPKKSTDDFQINRAAVGTQPKTEKNESVIDATSDVFDKFANGMEKVVNAIFKFFYSIVSAFIPAGANTKEVQNEAEASTELKEEDLKEAVEEINNILYEKDDAELEKEGIEDLGYVNTLDDDDDEPGYTEEDIARYLKEGDFDAITRVVTANGRKRSARSTSLSTVYDRRGKTERMQVDSRDEDILKGNETSEKFIKRI